MQETADGVGGVGVGVGLVAADCGGDGDAEHFGEAQGEEEADEDVDKDFGARGVDGLVARVVAGVGGPAGREAEDGGGEAQD